MFYPGIKFTAEYLKEEVNLLDKYKTYKWVN